MNGFVKALNGFANTLKEIHVIIALSIALIVGGFATLLAGTAAGALGFLVATLSIRGLTVVMKRWIKPETPEEKRRLLATIVAIPLMIVVMCVPALALRLVGAHLVPSVITASSYSWSLLLGMFISMSSIKHA